MTLEEMVGWLAARAIDYPTWCEEGEFTVDLNMGGDVELTYDCENTAELFARLVVAVALRRMRRAKESFGEAGER